MRNKSLIPPILALCVLATASVATGISQLDINDGQLIYDYAPGSNPRSDVEAWVTSGFNDYSWDGEGIMSTAAHNDPDQYTAVGWIDNADYGYTEFPEGGTAIDDTSILVAYTLYGDADLNLTVNFDDYYQWQAGYDDAQAGNPDGYLGWLWGDFDYNGVVNFDDYYLWQAGYDYVQGGGSLAAGSIVPVNLTIPEPVTGALGLGLAAVALYVRRRRTVQGRSA